MVFATLALAAFSGFAASSSALWLAQRRLIFGKPSRLRPLPHGPLADQHRVSTLHLPVTAAVALEGWSALPREAAPRRVLIYFGGRNEHVGWVPAMSTYVGAWSIYAFNYRGFGKSGGRPSEARAKADALKIYDEVMRLQGASVGEVAIMGRSLGTSIALSVAARRPVDRLVLLSPFDSLTALMRRHPVLKPVRWTLNQKFDCRADAGQLSAATAVFLAGSDSRIPHPNSLALWERLRRPALLGIVPGANHKTLPRHPETQARIAAYLNQGALAAPAPL